jgi:hypothetical protein
MQLYGQQGASSTKENTGKMMIPDVVAKPVFEGTNGGFHLRVWIMSVIKATNEDLNNNVSSEVNNGTHHIMVEVTDADSKKEMPGAVVKLIQTSPSQKESKLDLRPMMNHYGTNLTLDEKGEYQFNVSVNINGEEIVTPFRYTI